MTETGLIMAPGARGRWLIGPTTGGGLENKQTSRKSHYLMRLSLSLTRRIIEKAKLDPWISDESH